VAGTRGYGGEPAPTTPRDVDVLAELRRISVELRALSGSATAAVGREATFRGRDGSATVTVTINGRQHVQDVHVDARWAQRLPRDGVGDALMQAYGDAVGQVLTAAAQAVEQAARDVDEPGLHQQVEAELRSHRRRYVAPEDLVDHVRRELRQIDMLQRYGDTPTGAAAGPRDATVYGPGRFVEVTVRGGQISGVRVLLSRLPYMATNGTLAQEALAAFRAAADAARPGT
jgi:DNA-binding protein YbaB